MNENNNNEQIDVTDEEFKMPEEKFGITNVEEAPSHLGVILGILIVVLSLILGGLYLWSTTFQTQPVAETPIVERPTEEENNEPESTNAEADVQVLETLSTSDEIAALEADIESTNLDELDAELQAIEAELDAALQ